MSDLVDLGPTFKTLAQARSLGEVKAIRDKAAAIEAYAREAKDSELMDHAVEVRLLAERKAGRLLIEMAERGERDPGGRGRLSSRGEPNAPPGLADLGLGKRQSFLWQKLAALDDEAFAARLGQARRDAWAAIGLTAQERQDEKRERRAQREAELGAKQAALPDRRYGVILADPPWRFEPYSRETGMDRAAENHYPTLTTETIKALKIPAADDCALFLWATNPMLEAAIAVLKAWGFAYRSNFVWVKDRPGPGYWARERHELLLIGVRGDIPAPAPGEQFDSVIEAARGAHSAKPGDARERIAAMFPTLPRLEMFARGEAAAGWDVWGNEADHREKRHAIFAGDADRGSE